ncbi:MAG: hypothetical protein KatS3mg011_2311 [Acidimicrobiia bacterium]|nr:MAG: hypothetical protein KatS3mg011_2311 [Acidimicrobiia bacterium]
MPWLWSDDLARALIEAGTPPELVENWSVNPWAVAVPDGVDPVEAGRILLEGDQSAA